MVKKFSYLLQATGNPRRTIPLALLAAAFLAAGSALVGPSVASASPEAASSALCISGAQVLIQRKNMSCRYAKSVYRKCSSSFPACKGPAMECRGQKTRWRGWTITGIGVRSQGVRAKWTNGRYSFVASGGGTCG